MGEKCCPEGGKGKEKPAKKPSQGESKPKTETRLKW